MVLPTRPTKTAVPATAADAFVGGKPAKKPRCISRPNAKHFLWEVDPDLRNQLNIEARQKGYVNVSAYITAIVTKRNKLGL